MAAALPDGLGISGGSCGHRDVLRLRRAAKTVTENLAEGRAGRAGLLQRVVLHHRSRQLLDACLLISLRCHRTPVPSEDLYGPDVLACFE